jgi:molybdopterin converting factor small subunit
MTPTIRIEYYGLLRGITGRKAELLTLEAPVTVSALLERIGANHPRLAEHLAHSAVALDDVIARPDALVQPGTTLALLPPVGGG